MKSQKHWRTVALVVATLMVVGACGSQQGSGGGGSGGGSDGSGTLVVSVAGDPKVFNTNYTFDNYAYYTDRNIYSRLVGYDYASGELFGDLATKWSGSSDSLTWTFTLRSGVKWHDGQPFTSADVVWTYQDVMKVGAEAYSYPYVKDVDKVSAPDDTTVVFTLKNADATFPMTIADYYAPIVLAKHIYDGTEAKSNPANLKPVGTGPFQFVSMAAGDRVVMKRNPDYYGTKAQFENLVFRIMPNRATAITALKAGELGYATASPAFGEVADLRKVSGLTVDDTESNLIQFVGFNLAHKPLDDVRVRTAIAMAINTKDVNDKAYFGLATPSVGTYLSNNAVFDPTAKQPEFDLAKANALLDEAGHPRGANGTRFSVKFVTFAASIYGGPESAEVVKQQLKEVGIDATIDIIDVSLLSQVVKDGKFDLLTRAGSQGPNPQSFANFVGTGGGSNFMGYSSQVVDKAFADAKAAADPAERKSLYATMQQTLAKDLPRVNLVEYRYIRPHRSELSGFWWEAGSGGKGIGSDMYNGVVGVH